MLLRASQLFFVNEDRPVEVLGVAEYSLHSCPTISLGYVSFYPLVSPLNTSPGEDRVIAFENKNIVFEGYL